MNHYRKTTLAIALGIFATAATAQHSAGDSLTRIMGNGNVGQMMAHIESAYSYSSGSTVDLHKLRVLTRYLRRSSGVNGGRAFCSAHANQAIAQLTMLYDGDIVSRPSTTRSGSSAFASHSMKRWKQLDIYPWDPSITVWIGPVPVSCGGNAGVGISVELRAAAGALSLAASGSNESATWIYGRAWAMVGVPGFGAGVETRATLAKATLKTNVIADNGRVRATGVFAFTPVSVRIVPFLWAIVKIYGPTIAAFSSWVYYERLF